MSEHEQPSVRSTDDFFTLLTEQSATLLRMAGAMVGPNDAEDVVQEAVTRAWGAWPSLRDPEVARAWLLRIVGNVCRDWWHGPFGARQRLHLPLDGEVDERGAGAVYGATNEQAFHTPRANDPGSSDHVATLDLRQALDALDESLRLIITLRYFVGLDATEIGHALNIPSATVRTRLRHARAILRQRLTPPPPQVSAMRAFGGATCASSVVHPENAGSPTTSDEKGS